jgi:hypothetical protein
VVDEVARRLEDAGVRETFLASEAVSSMRAKAAGVAAR